ncbi:hypothetical protein L6R50_05235 [Myxococcota bacterium]|nr:hypothetical protein [Myxococcota bacterium]
MAAPAPPEARGEHPPPAPVRVPPGLAVAGLVAVCAALVGALWLPGRTVAYGDLFLYFPSLYSALGHAWDPYLQAGTPLLPNPQAGWFYPPAWLFAGDFVSGIAPFTFLHLLVAAVATWAWARTRFGDGLGPWLAAVAYAASGATWSLLVNPDKLPGHAMLPVALLGLTWWLSHPRPGRRGAGLALAAAAVGASWLAGSVEAVLLMGVVLPAWGAALPGEEARPADRLRGALAGLVGVAGGTALAGCVLVPFAVLLPESSRSEALSLAQLLSRATHPVDWLSWWAPDPLGTSGGLEAADPSVAPRPRYLRTLYGGVVVLPLAATGLVARGGRLGLAAATGLLACAALALGDANPLYPWLVTHVPGLGAVRYPEKWWLGTVAFTAWLVAAGWSAVEEGRRGPRVFASLAALSLGAAALCAGAAGGAAAEAGKAALAASPALVLAWGAVSAGGIGPRVRAAVVAMVVVADLLPAAWAVFEVERAGEVFAEPPLARAVRAAWGDRPGVPRLWDDSVHVLGGSPPRRPGESSDASLVRTLDPNLAVAYGIGYVDGRRAIGTLRHQRYAMRLDEVGPRDRRALLRSMGADFWVVWDPVRALELAAEAGLAPVPAAPGSSLDVGLLAEPAPLPRLRWVGERLDADGEGMAMAAILSRDPTRAVVVIAGDPGAPDLASLPRGETGAAVGRSDGGPGRVLAVANPEPGRWEVAWSAPRDGALVLQEGWAPGWEISVDGGAFRPAARVDFMLVGAAAPAGEHRAVLRYRAAGAGLGLGLTAAAAAGIALAALRVARPRRSRPRALDARGAHRHTVASRARERGPGDGR